jgi:hypothetical protein
MRWNRFLKSLLKEAVYILDQTAEQVDPASDRASPIPNGARSAIYPEENHTLRNILSFAVGLGLGVGAGILFAPASGEEIRSAIGDNIHDISSKVKERISTQKPATGTD